MNHGVTNLGVTRHAEQTIHETAAIVQAAIDGDDPDTVLDLKQTRLFVLVFFPLTGSTQFDSGILRLKIRVEAGFVPGPNVFSDRATHDCALYKFYTL